MPMMWFSVDGFKRKDGTVGILTKVISIARRITNTRYGNDVA